MLMAGADCATCIWEVPPTTGHTRARQRPQPAVHHPGWPSLLGNLLHPEPAASVPEAQIRVGLEAVGQC